MASLTDMLRANGSWEADAAVTAIQVRDNRIEKLEAALREITESARLVGDYYHVKIARKALEGKDG